MQSTFRLKQILGGMRCKSRTKKPEALGCNFQVEDIIINELEFVDTGQIKGFLSEPSSYFWLGLVIIQNGGNSCWLLAGVWCLVYSSTLKSEQASVAKVDKLWTKVAFKCVYIWNTICYKLLRERWVLMCTCLSGSKILVRLKSIKHWIYQMNRAVHAMNTAFLLHSCRDQFHLFPFLCLSLKICQSRRTCLTLLA